MVRVATQGVRGSVQHRVGRGSDIPVRVECISADAYTQHSASVMAMSSRIKYRSVCLVERVGRVLKSAQGV